MTKRSVTVVLNVFRRGRFLPKQLAAIKEQSAPVTEILAWENGEDHLGKYVREDEFDYHCRNSKNLGVWARFAFALNARSDFVWVIDDDVIPGRDWLRNALDTFEGQNGVIGSRGLRFASKHNYLIYDEFGPNNPSSKSEEVDIVGHNWIFPRAWLGLFWFEIESKFDSPTAGEDIHLSFAVQKHLGLPTIVPPHPPNMRNLWGEVGNSKGLVGEREVAISENPVSNVNFEKAYKHYIRKGFVPVSEKHGTAKTSKVAIASHKLIGKLPNLALRLARWLKFSKGRQ